MKNKIVILLFLTFFLQFCNNEKEACKSEYGATSKDIEFCKIIIGRMIDNNSNGKTDPNIAKVEILMGLFASSCLQSYEHKKKCDKKYKFYPEW